MGTLIPIAVLVIGGAMLANAIANPEGTKVIVKGFTDLWSGSLAALKSKA